MINNLKTVLFSAFFLLAAATLKAQAIVNLQQGKPSSIRGMSVIDDSVAWISGSKGYVATTHNGGKTWQWQQVKGFGKADFRAIEAFSATEAIVMSSGTPALVLKTTDGGASWKVKYYNADTTYFFDAMGFADKNHGYILGDPIKGKFLIMETKNRGESWQSFKNQPDALPGEAAFAASGTCFRVDKNKLTIVSGGFASRELTLVTKGYKDDWLQNKLPFPNQKSSEGAFSVAIKGTTKVFMGGDYANDKRTDSVVCYTLNDKTKLAFPKQGPNGYQSCVEYVTGDVFLATGTPGSNITKDNGNTWTKIDSTSFNVCRKAKHGKLVLLAGNGGKTAVLKL